MERDIFMVDYENRIAWFKTTDYPEDNMMFLRKPDGKYFPFIYYKYVKDQDGKTYYLYSENGLYILRYS